MAAKEKSPSKLPRVAVLLAGHGVILTKTVDFMIAHPGNEFAQNLIWFTANSVIGIASGYMALACADMPEGTNGARWFRHAESISRFNFLLTLVFLLIGVYVWSTRAVQ